MGVEKALLNVTHPVSVSNEIILRKSSYKEENWPYLDTFTGLLAKWQQHEDDDGERQTYILVKLQRDINQSNLWKNLPRKKHD